MSSTGAILFLKKSISNSGLIEPHRSRRLKEYFCPVLTSAVPLLCILLAPPTADDLPSNHRGAQQYHLKKDFPVQGCYGSPGLGEDPQLIFL
jgi:hypothetical protein